MVFREVDVVEVKEMLRLWVRARVRELLPKPINGAWGGDVDRRRGQHFPEGSRSSMRASRPVLPRQRRVTKRGRRGPASGTRQRQSSPTARLGVTPPTRQTLPERAEPDLTIETTTGMLPPGELVECCQHATALVVPYHRIPHSGQLELARDLGLSAVAPDVPTVRAQLGETKGD